MGPYLFSKKIKLFHVFLEDIFSFKWTLHIPAYPIVKGTNQLAKNKIIRKYEKDLSKNKKREKKHLKYIKYQQVKIKSNYI